jgi:hypothetical protein
MSSNNVGFRLGRDAWNRYSAEAQQRGVALGTHLRQRLEEQDRLIAELILHATVAHNAAAHQKAREESAPGTEPGTLIEVLLLVRSIAGPQKTDMAHKEVERLGIATWKWK